MLRQALDSSAVHSSLLVSLLRFAGETAGVRHTAKGHMTNSCRSSFLSEIPELGVPRQGVLSGQNAQNDAADLASLRDLVAEYTGGVNRRWAYSPGATNAHPGGAPVKHPILDDTSEKTLAELSRLAFPEKILPPSAGEGDLPISPSEGGHLRALLLPSSFTTPYAESAGDDGGNWNVLDEDAASSFVGVATYKKNTQQIVLRHLLPTYAMLSDKVLSSRYISRGAQIAEEAEMAEQAAKIAQSHRSVFLWGSEEKPTPNLFDVYLERFPQLSVEGFAQACVGSEIGGTIDPVTSTLEGTVHTNEGTLTAELGQDNEIVSGYFSNNSKFL